MDRQELLSCIFLLIIALVVMISSLNMGIGEFHNPGPGFVPFWSSLLLAFLTLIVLIINLYKKRKALLSDLWLDVHWGKNLIVVGALFVYCAVLSRLGYLLATLGLMFILLLLGKMKFRTVIIYSLLAVVLSYCIFYYGLRTPLPRGILTF